MSSQMIGDVVYARHYGAHFYRVLMNFRSGIKASGNILEVCPNNDVDRRDIYTMNQ